MCRRTPKSSNSHYLKSFSYQSANISARSPSREVRAIADSPSQFPLWQGGEGSQLYHFDPHDNWGVKVFVNLNNVAEENGPLHLLPADVSDRFNAKIGYTRERVPDDVVYSVCSRDDVWDSRGEAGTGLMVDTGRCLHYGSRKADRDRLVLMMNFTRPNCTNPGRCSTLDPLREELAQRLYAGDPVRHYVLTVAPPAQEEV